ncbi:MAG: cyclic nucleotide-binding domain-containing protein [Acidimicrobiia bacterium]
MDAIAFLKERTLFSTLSEKELELVVAFAKQREFDAGSVIVEEAHPGAYGFYLILDGRVRVEKGGDLLRELGPGEYFGEVALILRDTPRTADVIAVEPTTCLVMTRWDFRSLIGSHPEISAQIMEELARRLSRTDQALSD